MSYDVSSQQLTSQRITLTAQATPNKADFAPHIVDITHFPANSSTAAPTSTTIDGSSDNQH